MASKFSGDGVLNRFGPRFRTGRMAYGPFSWIRGIIGLIVVAIIGLLSLPLYWRDQGVPENVVNSWILIGWIIFFGALAIVGVIIWGVRSKKKREAAKQAASGPTAPVTPPSSVTPMTPPSTPETSLFSRLDQKEAAPPAVGMKYCIHCGKEILEGTQFCIHCGGKQ